MIKGKKGLVQSVSRAVGILQCFNQFKELGVTEISRLTNLNKSTAFGLISTLEYHDLLKKDKESGKYKLGNEIFRLGTRVNMDLRGVSIPYLSGLANKFQETVNLVIHTDYSVLYLAKIDSPHSMRICTRVGVKLPMYCTAVGKVILAYLKKDEINDILTKTKFIKYTDNTILDKDMLLTQLKSIREKGYAEDIEELEIGLVCVAAPIINHLDKPIAGLSVSGPATRMPAGLRMEIAETLCEYALEISKDLGY